MCRPNVISAYPITPQTHIVEDLARMVGEGELEAEFINVESEFSAASVVLGAAAAGARAYTTTTSQGLLLMNEVIYCIAGMRLPIVLTCANRAISAPLNIWNDHSDSMTVRDAGWIQLHAEDNQEAADLHMQAFKIAEQTNAAGDGLHGRLHPDPLLRAGGHAGTEGSGRLPAALQTPVYRRSPLAPGPGAVRRPPLLHGGALHPAPGPGEIRKGHRAGERDFAKKFGRQSGGLLRSYKLEDADLVIVTMGSIAGTIKDLIDQLEEEGKKVGLLQICSFRPFPRQAVYEALRDKMNIVVLEKSISLGRGGILASDIRWSFPRAEKNGRCISCYVAGLGGKNICTDDLRGMVERVEREPVELAFLGLNKEIIAARDL